LVVQELRNCISQTSRAGTISSPKSSPAQQQRWHHRKLSPGKLDVVARVLSRGAAAKDVEIENNVMTVSCGHVRLTHEDIGPFNLLFLL